MFHLDAAFDVDFKVYVIQPVSQRLILSEISLTCCAAVEPVLRQRIHSLRGLAAGPARRQETHLSSAAEVGAGRSGLRLPDGQVVLGGAGSAPAPDGALGQLRGGGGGEAAHLHAGQRGGLDGHSAGHGAPAVHRQERVPALRARCVRRNCVLHATCI